MLFFILWPFANRTLHWFGACVQCYHFPLSSLHNRWLKKINHTYPASAKCACARETYSYRSPVMTKNTCHNVNYTQYNFPGYHRHDGVYFCLNTLGKECTHQFMGVNSSLLSFLLCQTYGRCFTDNKRQTLDSKRLKSQIRLK